MACAKNVEMGLCRYIGIIFFRHPKPGNLFVSIKIYNNFKKYAIKNYEIARIDQAMSVPKPGYWFNRPEIPIKNENCSIDSVFYDKNDRDGTVDCACPSIRHPAGFACVLHGS
jgi:hypothetical protein